MSGLSRTPGKRVWVNSPPRVRIPPAPPKQKKPAQCAGFFLSVCFKGSICMPPKQGPPDREGQQISEPQRSVNAHHLCK